MSKDKMTNIGGYEFHVVKEGLDEAEVTDLVKKLLGNGGRADGQHQSLSSMQDFAKKMEGLATEAEKVAERVKQEAEAERSSLLTEAEQRASELVAEAEQRASELIAEGEQRASELIPEAEQRASELVAEAEKRASELVVEAETAAAAMKKEAAEVQHKARELQAETERAEAAMRSQAQELIQAAQSKAEQVITGARHLAEHRIPAVTDRMCRELGSMLDGLEAEFKAPPRSLGQTAEKASEEELEEAVPVTAEGEAEAQPEAEELEEAVPVPVTAEGEAEAQPEAEELEKLVSMLDGLEARFKASPGSPGQIAEEAFRKELEEAVPVTAEGEAEAQPEAEELEEAGGRPVPALAIGGQTAEKAPEEEPEEAVPVPVTAEGEAEAQPEAGGPEEAAPILYEGQVLLVVPGGTGALQLRRLQDGLRSFPEVKLLTQGGTMGGGSTLTLSIEKPFPLVQRLLEMPNVESIKGATPHRPQRPKSILRPFGRKPESQSSPPVIRLCLKNGGGNRTHWQPEDQET
jgi:hypothetical protein